MPPQLLSLEASGEETLDEPPSSPPRVRSLPPCASGEDGPLSPGAPRGRSTRHERPLKLPLPGAGTHDGGDDVSRRRSQRHSSPLPPPPTGGMRNRSLSPKDNRRSGPTSRAHSPQPRRFSLDAPDLVTDLGVPQAPMSPLSPRTSPWAVAASELGTAGSISTGAIVRRPSRSPRGKRRSAQRTSPSQSPQPRSLALLDLGADPKAPRALRSPVAASELEAPPAGMPPRSPPSSHTSGPSLLPVQLTAVPPAPVIALFEPALEPPPTQPSSRQMASSARAKPLRESQRSATLHPGDTGIALRIISVGSSVSDEGAGSLLRRATDLDDTMIDRAVLPAAEAAAHVAARDPAATPTNWRDGGIVAQSGISPAPSGIDPTVWAELTPDIRAELSAQAVQQEQHYDQRHDDDARPPPRPPKSDPGDTPPQLNPSRSSILLLTQDSTRYVPVHHIGPGDERPLYASKDGTSSPVAPAPEFVVSSATEFVVRCIPDYSEVADFELEIEAEASVPTLPGGATFDQAPNNAPVPAPVAAAPATNPAQHAQFGSQIPPPVQPSVAVMVAEAPNSPDQFRRLSPDSIVQQQPITGNDDRQSSREPLSPGVAVSQRRSSSPERAMLALGMSVQPIYASHQQGGVPHQQQQQYMQPYHMPPQQCQQPSSPGQQRRASAVMLAPGVSVQPIDASHQQGGVPHQQQQQYMQPYHMLPQQYQQPSSPGQQRRASAVMLPPVTTSGSLGYIGSTQPSARRSSANVHLGDDGSVAAAGRSRRRSCSPSGQSRSKSQEQGSSPRRRSRSKSPSGVMVYDGSKGLRHGRKGGRQNNGDDDWVPKAGDFVEVQEHDSRGEKGVVIGYNEEKQRYRIQMLYRNGQIFAKAKNLIKTKLPKATSGDLAVMSSNSKAAMAAMAQHGNNSETAVGKHGHHNRKKEGLGDSSLYHDDCVTSTFSSGSGNPGMAGGSHYAAGEYGYGAEYEENWADDY